MYLKEMHTQLYQKAGTSVIHSSLAHNCPKWKQPKCLLRVKWTNKWQCIQVLNNNEDEESTTTPKNMQKLHKHDIEQKKSQSKREGKLYYSIYVLGKATYGVQSQVAISRGW
jgi:hypothetical protein